MSNPSARPAFTPERAHQLGQRGIVLLGSLAILGGALAVVRPASAQENTAQANTAQANTAQANTAQALVSTSTAATVPPGTNLLANADAAAGDTSAEGWDAVTIPGWQIGSGLPTIVRYGTPGFPKAAQPPKDPGNLFVWRRGRHRHPRLERARDPGPPAALSALSRSSPSTRTRPTASAPPSASRRWLSQNPFSRTDRWLDNSRPPHLRPGPLNVGAYPYPTVITITGQTAVIVEPYGYTVELINLKTRHVFPPITVGAFPTAVAITARRRGRAPVSST